MPINGGRDGSASPSEYVDSQMDVVIEEIDKILSENDAVNNESAPESFFTKRVRGCRALCRECNRQGK